MQPTTLSRILPIAAKALNLSVRDDRAELLDEIDECRHLMFTGLGDAVREAFFVRKDCTPVRRFARECRDRCKEPFHGWSLPPDCISAEVFYIEGRRIVIEHEYTGLQRYRGNAHCPRAVDLGDGYPLPCDPEGVFELGFRLASLERPKSPLAVGVHYIDPNGSDTREDVELTNDIRFTSSSVKALHRHGITLPPDRCDMVEVWINGEKMAEYHPSIDTPNYRRYGLHGPCRLGDQIEMRDATFQPRRAVFDSDPIETGDPNFWRNLLIWKELHYKTKRTNPENTSYQTFQAFLIGQAQSLLEMKQPDTAIVTLEPETAMGGLDRYNTLRTRRRMGW